MTADLPQELIRAKRDGAVLTTAQVEAFVRGLVDGGFSDAQVGAMAMAIVLRGMDTSETAALTAAMTHSGEVLDWRGAGLPAGHGPIVDKHSTGGVGDKVSLMLAPLLAACGAVVPMISGRGLGHTGGTLDKLEALPGYTVTPSHATLVAALRASGCAIVGASERVAPAGAPDPALIEREQHAVHGFAWAAATLAATEATTDWAARAASAGRFGQIEELTLRIALGEAFGQLAYGLSMSASEVVRPTAFGCEAEARALAAEPAVARFLADGSTAETRAALAALLAEYGLFGA